jgi:DNA replication protein DnaC
MMDRAYSVIYLSAIKLFDVLAKAAFRSEKDDNNNDYILKHIYECDLLIIDDLGTELTNTFTSSALFGCINERYLNKKSTIISTNYSIEDMKNYYSERIFSRITSNYTLLKIYGEDIRVKKKLEDY